MNLLNLVRHVQSISKDLGGVQFIEHAKISEFHWFNIKVQVENRLISDKAFTGIDLNPLVALSKACSEMVERKSFSIGHELGLRSCQTERSDGFAAYPKNPGTLSQQKARENALAEAIERYAWANWWDDLEIAYSQKTYSLDEFKNVFPSAAKMMAEINSATPVKTIHIIIPEFSNYADHQLIILVAEIQDGLVTGGACGKILDIDNTLVRAMSELFRHALVAIQNRELLMVLNFYERRLLYFLSPEGLSTFFKRISLRGNKQISFPKLSIDEIIDVESTHIVHRCLFENQPAFIGGAVERMCL